MIRSAVSRMVRLLSQLTGVISLVTVLMEGGVRPVDRWLARSAARNAADTIRQIQARRHEELHVLRHLSTG